MADDLLQNLVQIYEIKIFCIFIKDSATETQLLPDEVDSKIKESAGNATAEPTVQQIPPHDEENKSTGNHYFKMLFFWKTYLKIVQEKIGNS